MPKSGIFSKLTSVFYVSYFYKVTLFENRWKNLVLQQYENSELLLHFGPKFVKMPYMMDFASFWKSRACGKKVLPDRLNLNWQKLLEVPNEKLERDI